MANGYERGASAWMSSLIPGAGTVPPVAPRSTFLIEPGQQAARLTPRDKMRLGFEHAVSPLGVMGWFASAGWGQLTDGYPKFGVDKGAFGMRLGTGALRDSSEAIFSDSFAAAALHEDPRYYRMGLHHNIVHRIAYAASRPLVTRSDSGRHVPNLALMAGTLAGAALTNTYYPANSRGADITFRTFGWSMEGSVVGDLLREFYGDVGDAIRARRNEGTAP